MRWLLGRECESVVLVTLMPSGADVYKLLAVYYNVYICPTYGCIMYYCILTRRGATHKSQNPHAGCRKPTREGIFARTFSLVLYGYEAGPTQAHTHGRDFFASKVLLSALRL